MSPETPPHWAPVNHGNTHRLLADHSTSNGRILPRLSHITFALLLLLAFTLPAWL
jgi:hypothetical protein